MCMFADHVDKTGSQTLDLIFQLELEDYLEEHPEADKQLGLEDYLEEHPEVDKQVNEEEGIRGNYQECLFVLKEDLMYEQLQDFDEKTDYGLDLKDIKRDMYYDIIDLSIVISSDCKVMDNVCGRFYSYMKRGQFFWSRKL
eukprot:639152-Hanusia_phi.AAC.1